MTQYVGKCPFYRKRPLVRKPLGDMRSGFVGATWEPQMPIPDISTHVRFRQIVALTCGFTDIGGHG
jgi:hypothetical protein